MGILDLSEVQNVQTDTGSPASNALRYIYLGDSDNLATLYKNPSLAAQFTTANPMVADESGWFDTCFLEDGSYRVLIKTQNGDTLFERHDVEVVSPLAHSIVREFRKVEHMLGDEILSYVAGQGRHRVVPGDYITVADQNFTYIVANEEAVDFHLQTAGGVRLCVLVGEHGRYSSDAFNVDRSGATNCTAALKMFYEVCIEDKKDGILPAGTYLITPGELAFDNNHVDTTLPYFHTSGYHSTIFQADTDEDAPFLTFTNGTASTLAGRYWIGGGHGGLRFVRPATLGANVNTGQHGISLRGIHGSKFEGFFGIELGGNVVHIERKFFQGNNPDPYHVFCSIEYIEATRCLGYAFYNDNYVGFNGSRIGVLRAAECGGVYWGIGAGNQIGIMTAGSCSGWAIGDHTDAAGGASSRFRLGVAEFDNIEYGLQWGRLSTSKFGSIRFVHRYETSVKNQGTNEYWPRVAIDIGSIAAYNLSADVIHRVESGGTLADLGDFADFNFGGGNITGIRLHTEILDEAGLGIESARLLSNFNHNTRAQYTVKGRAPIIDNMDSVACLVRGTTSTQIPHGGFSGSQTIIWPTVQNDPALLYDTSTGLYTCPYDGMYNVRASIVLDPNAAGERVRLGVAANGTIISAHHHYAVTANPTVFNLDFTVFGYRDQKIGIVADQNSGTAKNLTTLISINESHMAISPVR